MKKIIISTLSSLLVLSCGIGGETKYIINESDLDYIFEKTEIVEDKIDELVKCGVANQDDLIELQREVKALKGSLEDGFIDEGDAEPI